ncbi:MAG: tRNA uridine-5-carboxymethylaminomethyl(34) synthesis enzyme MnmG [Candidatus Dependentiae bacterium]|nr:tRNA uridine-5-carboxymethylaminomethyl(34) synthesis enzyme MnmG [Candidatus Dependentiae bacterium]
MDRCGYTYDVIVIGGGHAGIEAAYAAARMGVRTCLITLSKERIGLMPCNPSIGGIGKGHIVFEIAALGGLMPQLCTATYLQAKMLNTRKGPAVQGLRLQIDKEAYRNAAQRRLAETEYLTIVEGMVSRLLCEQTQANAKTKNFILHGVALACGTQYRAPTVVLTAGTFLNGVIHIGEESFPAGRRDEPAAVELAQFLRQLGIKTGRMKTGTPARLLRSSIDFSGMALDEANTPDYLFEFAPHTAVTRMPCYLTHTTPETHKIILESAHRSPIFSKRITGTPTRYCPSIEDKITRFAHKDAHHVFVEPESASNDIIYPNGISNSLPKDIQERMIQSIPGFERAVILQYAYGIEYDFFPPEQLHHTLELKEFPGLFFAGQVNGTTGYEEAAGQGIIAGINAALKVQGREPYVMSRNAGYIGIMVDDLVSSGVDEPYRMFTSRAERRLLLRQDNAFDRLSPQAFELGLIDREQCEKVLAERAAVVGTLAQFEATGMMKQFAQLISNNHPDQVKNEIARLGGGLLSRRSIETIYAEILYGPYKRRELREIEKSETYKNLKIPDTLRYKDMPGLSRELQEKLVRYAPATIAQAALIKGMTPATLSLLIFRVREMARQKSTAEL